MCQASGEQGGWQTSTVEQHSSLRLLQLLKYSFECRFMRIQNILIHFQIPINAAILNKSGRIDTLKHLLWIAMRGDNFYGAIFATWDPDCFNPLDLGAWMFLSFFLFRRSKMVVMLYFSLSWMRDDWGRCQKNPDRKTILGFSEGDESVRRFSALGMGRKGAEARICCTWDSWRIVPIGTWTIAAMSILVAIINSGLVDTIKDWREFSSSCRRLMLYILFFGICFIRVFVSPVTKIDWWGVVSGRLVLILYFRFLVLLNTCMISKFH